LLCIKTIYFRASPDSAQLATSLGLLYLQEGKYQHALEKLGGALARDPQCVQALLAAGAMMQVSHYLKLFLKHLKAKAEKKEVIDPSYFFKIIIPEPF